MEEKISSFHACAAMKIYGDIRFCFNASRYTLCLFFQSSSSNGVPLLATIHNGLSTTACTSVDTFAIVHVTVVQRHPDKCCDPTHSVSHTKKCRDFHSIFCLRNHFEIHNNNIPFSSMSELQSIGWIKQKLGNNCQTTRIVTIKVYFSLFRPTWYINK